MDRIDLRVHVPRLAYDELRGEGRETSRIVRARVLAARDRMRERLAGTSRRTNAELTVAEVRLHCRLDDTADALAGEAMRSRRLSARGVHRVMRVARTIADLAGSDRIRGEDLAFALLLRGAA
jgi:magnesium chelatase family protein